MVFTLNLQIDFRRRGGRGLDGDEAAVGADEKESVGIRPAVMPVQAWAMDMDCAAGDPRGACWTRMRDCSRARGSVRQQLGFEGLEQGDRRADGKLRVPSRVERGGGGGRSAGRRGGDVDAMPTTAWAIGRFVRASTRIPPSLRGPMRESWASGGRWRGWWLVGSRSGGRGCSGGSKGSGAGGQSWAKEDADVEDVARAECQVWPPRPRPAVCSLRKRRSREALQPFAAARALVLWRR